MLEWRGRMRARRRARRRYLSVAFERWRADGVPPPTHSRTPQVLITLLWLLVPGLLALACGVLLLLAQDATAPAELRPTLGVVVVVPMLVLLILRGTLRR